jgi:hypothetical protein
MSLPQFLAAPLTPDVLDTVVVKDLVLPVNLTV